MCFQRTRYLLSFIVSNQTIVARGQQSHIVVVVVVVVAATVVMVTSVIGIDTTGQSGGYT